ncbi:lytic murein transglycosylase [Microvirga arsenatis]|uniref:Lytic murein transglycosylase n=1 Tax=Microvirga arsenatis TaxID=2692265 RepID=A0ABW9Z2H8_9HYPH|nr:lytic murein transglycosylase [Microvirga arsenatis]NBJ10257.1 lytic murein transglycosylase [Microvirga arsenatis]NBJ24844.1 lytic murein transglycosylase [Microvirga arsenatis]
MKNILAPALFVLAGLAATPATAQADFGSCLAGLRSQAAAKGISAQAFDAATRGIAPDLTILDLMNNQPEFKTPIWDYLAALVDDERVQDGRMAMRQWGQALAAAEARFGVDRHAIAGVWGVESNFGKDIGGRPLVQSLATLVCYAPRRNEYFKGELMATLKIVQDGDINPTALRGSWAGAFGHTQFMPSTFQRLAVDGDGDGRRDIMNSVPDAVHSTANFLKKAGWVNGLPWGYEVRLPENFNPGLAGRKNKKPLSTWAAMGVRRIDGRPLEGNYAAGIIIPAGVNGPAFIVTKNFDAVYSYNAAESYGLAIALLGDRLKGLPGIQTAWPTDDPPLSRAQRRELQQLLTARGYDVGEPDGKIGAKTREAIKDVERRIGLEPRGRPGGKVLQALRG